MHIHGAPQSARTVEDMRAVDLHLQLLKHQSMNPDLQSVRGDMTDRDALKNLREMFADAGYKDCAVRHYMSAASGKKQ